MEGILKRALRLAAEPFIFVLAVLIAIAVIVWIPVQLFLEELRFRIWGPRPFPPGYRMYESPRDRGFK